MSIKTNIYRWFHVIYFILAFLFLMCLYKIFEIQSINGETWKDISTFIKKQNKPRKLEPIRGKIYCINRNKEEEIVAGSMLVYKVYFDGNQLVAIEEDLKKKSKTFNRSDSITKLARGLSDFFGDASAKSYENLIVSAYQSKKKVLLNPRKIDYVERKKLAKLPLLNGAKGKYVSCLNTVEQNKRIRPFGDLACRTIGDVYADKSHATDGSSGIEKHFDSILRGKSGMVRPLRINMRKFIYEAADKAVDGADITLTLDMEMQEIVTNCLMEGVLKTGAERACAILMETATGEIKAMANLGRTASGNYSEINASDMAISDYNELGSVFKLPSIMVALESGIVTDSTMIDVEHSAYIIKDHKKLYGKKSVANVIAMSSNVGTSNIVCPFFERKQAEFVELIKKTHFDTPIVDEFLNQKQPELYEVYDSHHRRDTSLHTFATFTLGYQAKIPPIYMLRFYNAIANNGKMIDPFIVKKIENKNGVIFSSDKRIITDKICSPSVLKSIQNMLLQVVESSCGTAYYKIVSTDKPKIKLAGKTGTADLSTPVASKGTFCGYFPADKPQYSCIVVMQRNGKINLWGTESYIVFKNIAEKIFAITNVTEFSQFNDSINYSPKNLNLDDKKIKYLAKYCKIK